MLTPDWRISQASNFAGLVIAVFAVIVVVDTLTQPFVDVDVVAPRLSSCSDD